MAHSRRFFGSGGGGSIGRLVRRGRPVSPSYGHSPAAYRHHPEKQAAYRRQTGGFYHHEFFGHRSHPAANPVLRSSSETCGLAVKTGIGGGARQLWHQG